MNGVVDEDSERPSCGQGIAGRYHDGTRRLKDRFASPVLHWSRIDSTERHHLNTSTPQHLLTSHGHRAVTTTTTRLDCSGGPAVCHLLLP